MWGRLSNDKGTIQTEINAVSKIELYEDQIFNTDVYKISKDRFSSMPCHNVTGTFWFALLVFGKSQNSKVLKNVNTDHVQ